MTGLSPVVPGLWRLELGVVNAYFLAADGGLVLVDTGTPGSEAAVLAAVEALGHGPEAVRAIVVTHHHADHTGALAAVLAATGAETWVHAGAVRLGDGGRPVRASSGLVDLVLRWLPARPDAAYPPAAVAHEVADGDALPGGLRAVHAPGHTASHLALLWPAHGGVLLAGDACTTRPVLTRSVVYEDPAAGRETLRRLGALPFEAAVFGHGDPIVGGAAARFREVFGGEKKRPAEAGSAGRGGEGGIRTHGTREGTTVFETAPFDHSGTSPGGAQTTPPRGRARGGPDEKSRNARAHGGRPGTGA